MLSYPYLQPYTASGMPVGSINLDGNGNNNPIAARDLSGKIILKRPIFKVMYPCVINCRLSKD